MATGYERLQRNILNTMKTKIKYKQKIKRAILKKTLLLLYFNLNIKSLNLNMNAYRNVKLSKFCFR